MKKFSLFLLYFLTPIITVSAQNSNNIDVGENFENKNARKTEVQPLVNSEVNPFLPNTNEKTALMPNINSRHKDGWGERKNESFTAKKFRLFKDNEQKRPITQNQENNSNTFYNCPVPSTKNKYCLPEKGQLNTELGVVLRQSNPNLDSDGFITDLPKPVLYGQGEGNLKNYFYRFWNENPKDCESTKQTSCWSPAYPIICNSNFNHTEFAKLENDKNGALKARHYFGWKENLSNDTNAYTADNDYKVHVFMAPIKKSHKYLYEDTNNGIFTALSPTGWKINGNCLDPEFDYDLTSTDSNDTTTETLVTDDTESSLSKQKTITKQQQILPCGNFSNNNGYKNKSFKEIANQTCRNSDKYYSIKSNSGYNYDKYIIHMPLSEKFTNLNSLTERNNYDKKNKNTAKQMKTRICGTCKNIDLYDVCEEIVRGILFEKCPPSGNKFKCNEQQLDSVVLKLKFGGGNFTGKTTDNKISGYTQQALECKVCLYNLDIILAGGTRDDTTYNGLLD